MAIISLLLPDPAARYPTPTLYAPVVLPANVPLPIAIFLSAVVFAANADSPIATLLPPVVLADRLFEVVLIQLLRWLLDHPDEAGIPAGLITGLSEPRLARALSALHEHPGKPWSLERMAERAGMSRSAFAAGFKAAVGQTPANYLAHWRLMLAQAQLRQGRSIKAIADELGYANPSALSRLFTQKIGRSPRHWLTQQD